MKTKRKLYLIIFTVFAAVLSGCSKNTESLDNSEKISGIAFSEAVINRMELF